MNAKMGAPERVAYLHQWVFGGETDHVRDLMCVGVLISGMFALIRVVLGGDGHFASAPFWASVCVLFMIAHTIRNSRTNARWQRILDEYHKLLDENPDAGFRTEVNEILRTKYFEEDEKYLARLRASLYLSVEPKEHKKDQ